MTDRKILLEGIVHFAEEIAWYESRAAARDLDNPAEAKRRRDRARDFAAMRDAMVETIARLDAGEIE